MSCASYIKIYKLHSCFVLRDEDGFYQITGRMDDVINVTGHRLGTAEVGPVILLKEEMSELVREGKGRL